MLKNLLSFEIKYRVLLWQQKHKPLSYFKDTMLDNNKKKAFIFLAADYGNLGDVAITYAQTNFLKQNTDCQVIEIPISQSLEGLWFVKRNIQPEDIVSTVGGGNMGELYNQIEFIRQLVFEFFSNNKIISFPQTFDFTETPEGENALNKAKKAYAKPKQLNLIAREKTSFQLMKDNFKEAQVLLTPDIVLSLNKSKPNFKREGALICLRSDKEKALTDEQNVFIIEKVKSEYDKHGFYDTHIGRNNLSLKERDEELNKIWNAFKAAEVVITDRLHGMIFCYITKTPCIVFQNNNHKVLGTFDWIEDNGFIRLMEKFDEQNFIKALKQDIPNDLPELNLEKHFAPLRTALKN